MSNLTKDNLPVLHDRPDSIDNAGELLYNWGVSDAVFLLVLVDFVEESKDLA